MVSKIQDVKIPELKVVDTEGAEDRPIFLCYRQVDGKLYARWIYDALRERLDATSESSVIYFDQAAPAVNDWQALHGPALERASAILVICTPGLYSDQGPNDWVHRELDWWLQNRSTAPIIIDTTGEDARWIPEKLKKRWPNQQRVNLDPDLWETASVDEITMVRRQVVEQILGGIAKSEVQVVHEDLEKSKRQNKRLKTYASGLLVLAIALGFSVNYALNQSSIAEKREKEAVSSLKQNMALDMTINAMELAQNNPSQSIRILEAANALSPDNKTIHKNAYDMYLNSHRFRLYSRELESSFASPHTIISPDNTRFVEIENGRGTISSSKGIVKKISGKEIGEIIVDNKEPEAIQFFPLTNRVASLAEKEDEQGISHNVLRIYSAKGKLTTEFSPKNRLIEGFSISPNEEFLLTVERKKVGNNLKTVLVKRLLPNMKLDMEYNLSAEGANGFNWHPVKTQVVLSTNESVVVLSPDVDHSIILPFKGALNPIFSPKGTYFAAASTSLKKAVVWDMKGKEILSIPHDSYVWSISFSPDEHLVTTASWDETVKITSIDRTIEKIINNKSRTWFAPFNQNGAQILAMSKDSGGARLWSSEGKGFSQLEKERSINHGQYLKGSNEILTATDDGVKIWPSGGHFRLLGKGSWYVRNNKSYAQIEGNILKYMDLSGETLFTYKFPKQVASFDFDGDATVAVIHHYEDSEERDSLNEPVSSEIFVFKEHKLVHRKKTEFAVFRPDVDEKREQFIVTCSDGKARLYDYTVTKIQEFSSNAPYRVDIIDDASSARISSSSGKIMITTGIGFVKIFDIDGNLIDESPLGIREDNYPTPTSFSSSTKTAAFSSNDDMIAVFPGESYFVVKNLKSNTSRKIILQHDGGIHDLLHNGSFINGSNLVITSSNRETSIWNADTGLLMARLPRDMKFLSQSPDGSLLLMRIGDHTYEVVSPGGVFNWLASAKVAPLNRKYREKFNLVKRTANTLH